MSLFLLIGLAGIVIVSLNRTKFFRITGENNKLVDKLKQTEWFQKHWLSGICLFALNAFLFLVTGMIIYLLTFLFIPYIHLVVMIMAVIVSLYFWGIFNQSFLGNKRERLIGSAVGSSFYFILALIFIYMLVTLEPLYPGEDTFMRAIGLFLGFIVTTVAFLTCFILTGLSRRNVYK